MPFGQTCLEARLVVRRGRPGCAGLPELVAGLASGVPRLANSAAFRRGPRSDATVMHVPSESRSARSCRPWAASRRDRWSALPGSSMAARQPTDVQASYASPFRQASTHIQG